LRYFEYYYGNFYIVGISDKYKLFYNNNYIDNNNIRNIILLTKNNDIYDLNLNFDTFDNSNILLKGYVGYRGHGDGVNYDGGDSFWAAQVTEMNLLDPDLLENQISNITGLKLNDFYLFINTLNLSKYVNINGENQWVSSRLNLYNYKFLDLYTNNIFNINSLNNVIVDTSDYVYMYQGNFQGYYSKTLLGNGSDIIYELKIIKGSDVITGDLLLTMYDDGESNVNPTVFRINSVKYNNYSILTLNNFLYYDCLNKLIYYVSNDIIDSGLVFTGSKKFEGYFTGLLEPPTNPLDVVKNYYINLNNNTFNTWYNNSWVQTILGLYKYKFKVNPDITITISIIDGNDIISSSAINNVSLYPDNNIPNKIIFNNVEIYNLEDLPNPEDENIGRILFLTNEANGGNIFEVNNVTVSGSQSNQWVYYSLSPTSILNMLDGSQYILHSSENNYTLTQNKIFTGFIVNLLPLNIDNYKLGDKFLLINNTINSGKIYEVSYINYSVDEPYELRELYSDNCYFIEINTCKNYTVNYNGINSYIVEKPETNYFVGYIITENIVDYIENEYYSLNISSSFNIDNRIFNYGDICISKDNKLNKLFIDNESYEIYNKTNGLFSTNNKLDKTYVFDNNIYGLKEYSGYCIPVNDINNLPLVKYKPGTFVLTFTSLENEIKIYLYTTNYNLIPLLPKTIFKNITDGKLYIVENNLLTQIKPGLKLDEAIVDKYIKNFNDSNESVNLLKSSSRIIKQNIMINDKGFIKFNVQPPIDSILESDCVNILKDENNIYWFNSTNIINNKTIIFEYYINGINYNLLYSINRQFIKSLTYDSVSFTGSINFENAIIIDENYQLKDLNNIINITYTQLISDSNINSNGEFNVIESGIYDLSVIINYKYDATVNNVNFNNINDLPYYSINNGNVELSKTIIQFMSYNISSNNNYSPIDNGIVKINSILELEEGDIISLYYNNKSSQRNVSFINSYFNIVRIS